MVLFISTQDFGLAHASKAVTPRDATGQWAQRIDSVVNGPQSQVLLATAYKTPSTESLGLNRYSLVSLLSVLHLFY